MSEEPSLSPIKPSINFTMSEELDFVTSPNQILEALLTSKQTGCSICIRSTALGDTVVTMVEDIIFHDEATVIVLKHFDSTGYILPSHKINLHEIQAVCPLSTQFVNPFVNNITKNKTWYF